MVSTDVYGLGPPPRTLTPAMRRLLRKQHPAVATWVCGMLAAVLGVPYLGMVIVGVGPMVMATSAVWPAGLTLGAILGWLPVRRERSRLAAVLADGQLTQARVLEVRLLTQHVRYGRVIRSTYRARFDVAGQPGSIVTADDGITMLEVGRSEEVLFDPRAPDKTVPTLILPT